MQGMSTAIRPPIAPKNIGSKRRKRLVYFLLGGFLLWATYVYIGQEQRLDVQRAELEKLQAEMTALQGEREAHLHQVQRLHDLEYIEQLARKDYFLSKPGETLFITPSQDTR